MEHPDLLAGHQGFEDAGIFRIDGERALVQTLDFFPPIVDDPRWFGRIAAANSLSDVYAMGGAPLTAMNIVGWPKDLDVQVLGEILQGGLEKVQEAGAVLCGGHSVTDAEIKFGLSVTGIVHPNRWWPNVGAREGDVLLLTKPLGMGPVSTAIKRQKATAQMVEGAMRQMATLNRDAAAAMQGLKVHGATDVTGFGLMGHGCEMAEGAGLVLELRAADVPVFPGARDLVASGVLSGGCTRGKAWLADRVQVAEAVDEALRDLMFDAETSGGLLLALSEAEAETALRRLRDAGTPCHQLVGRFRARSGDEAFVQVR
ncbi:MAG: selenide, water dikinase SelD [Planctomycetota bacterium]